MPAHHFNTIILILFLFTRCSTQSNNSTENPTASIEPYYDLQFSDIERDSMLSNLEEKKSTYKKIHDFKLDNDVSMSLQFNPYPLEFKIDENQLPIDWGLPGNVQLPSTKEEIAFLPVYKLAVLIKTKKISSVELTNLYLERLEKYSDTLQCVVTLMKNNALQQAARADEELARGIYRGPLHGIPYGIKDLFSVSGTKTTWGARPYLDQVINETATIVDRLEKQGAVLVAKLTMGALAMGDIWYGGKTKNPWNLEQGSSGSSAGSASATAAGLVGFAIGTETWGSIISPSNRCGVTGLRPTYGSVSRHGAMALSWSMDKVGPIGRSALDCAIVFDAIRGEDGLDKTVKSAAFNYSAKNKLNGLKVGYIRGYFKADTANKESNDKVLATLGKLGVHPSLVELPSRIPVDELTIILSAEAAAAFDELTRSNRDSLLVNQLKWAWPNSFRSSRFIPAVEYVNATRLRLLLIEDYHNATKDFDVIITPTYGGDQLLMTNLTGHPCIVVPTGFNKDGSPVSISFLGKLHGEAALIAIARAYQEATEWDEKVPPLFSK